MKPGDIIHGRYRIDSVLGAGGYARVFRATELQTERAVAIKVILAEAGRDHKTTLRRFEREAKVLGSLHDPHTLRLFDFGETVEGDIFLVSEFVAGRPLNEVMYEMGPMPEGLVVHVVLQTCMALREAHSHGIVHRDVKPANVLVYPYADDPYRVKLIDFGIAAIMETEERPAGTQLTQFGTAVGTVRYMAPEQVCGEPVGPWSDLYSLGVVAWEMLVGRPAFASTNHAQVATEVLTTRLRLPADLRVSPLVRSVVEAMIDPEVPTRLGSAQQAIDALDARTQAYPPAPTTGAMPLAPATENSAAMRWFSLVAGVAALGGIIAGIALLASPGDVPPPPPDEVRQAASERVEPDVPERDEEPEVLTTEAAVAVADLGVSESSPADMGSDSGPDAGSAIVSRRSEGCGVAVKKNARGLRKNSTLFEGRTFSWSTYIPDDYEKEVAHPLVIMIPDQYRSPKSAVQRSAAHAWMKKYGVVFAMPKFDGLPHVYPVDLRNIVGVVEEMSRDYCIDPTRIFAIGTGQSGRIAENLMCVLDLAAVASISHRGEQPLTMCDTVRETPLLILSGDRDPYAPVNGGRNCGGASSISLDDKESFWRGELICSDQKGPYVENEYGSCTMWRCRDSPLVSCRVSGGFGWPDAELRGTNLAAKLAGVGGCSESTTQFPTIEVVEKFFVLNGLDDAGPRSGAP